MDHEANTIEGTRTNWMNTKATCFIRTNDYIVLQPQQHVLFPPAIHPFAHSSSPLSLEWLYETLKKRGNWPPHRISVFVPSCDFAQCDKQKEKINKKTSARKGKKNKPWRTPCRVKMRSSERNASKERGEDGSWPFLRRTT